MIKDFLERFESAKPTLLAGFKTAHPENYKAIVAAVVEAVRPTGDHAYDWESPDPARIHEIDDGYYQGTLVYVIAAGGYQPSDYWYVKVGYGSCSGCDTLEGIREYSSDAPSDEQAAQYLVLATHIVQGLKKMGNDDQTGPY